MILFSEFIHVCNKTSHAVTVLPSLSLVSLNFSVIRTVEKFVKSFDLKIRLSLNSARKISNLLWTGFLRSSKSFTNC